VFKTKKLCSKWLPVNKILEFLSNLQLLSVAISPNFPCKELFQAANAQKMDSMRVEDLVEANSVSEK
jgi:hypothetical protein